MNPATKSDILSLISLIRKTFGRYPEYSGGCYKFHLILNKVFNGQGFYDSNHVLTKIGSHYYDIDGEYVRSTSNFLPLESFGIEHIEKSFKKHL
ncbi:MAG: hypothetical protein ACWA5P_02870 [bacterium]